MELEHGWHRANDARTALQRREYLDEVFAVIPVEGFTREMGALAAEIDANAKKAGRVIALADLLIGVTALHHGYAVGTGNLRHFRMIPNLKVISL
jgi:predicted nucleic acid-binding protein